jgi:hypothetical protein
VPSGGRIDSAVRRKDTTPPGVGGDSAPSSNDRRVYGDHAFSPEQCGIPTNLVAKNGREVLAAGVTAECVTSLRSSVISNWGERPTENLIFPV